MVISEIVKHFVIFFFRFRFSLSQFFLVFVSLLFSVSHSSSLIHLVLYSLSLVHFSLLSSVLIFYRTPLSQLLFSSSLLFHPPTRFIILSNVMQSISPFCYLPETFCTIWNVPAGADMHERFQLIFNTKKKNRDRLKSVCEPEKKKFLNFVSDLFWMYSQTVI